MKLGKVIFSQACGIPSVHRGGGVGFPACITGHITRGVLHPGGLGRSPPIHGILWDRSTSGQYASYWNAFLLLDKVRSRNQCLKLVFKQWWCSKIGVFLNGTELPLNSANSGNLINHQNMNWAQFKDPVSHMHVSSSTLDDKIILSLNSAKQTPVTRTYLLI